MSIGDVGWIEALRNTCGCYRSGLGFGLSSSDVAHDDAEKETRAAKRLRLRKLRTHTKSSKLLCESRARRRRRVTSYFPRRHVTTLGSLDEKYGTATVWMKRKMDFYDCMEFNDKCGAIYTYFNFQRCKWFGTQSLGTQSYDNFQRCKRLGTQSVGNQSIWTMGLNQVGLKQLASYYYNYLRYKCLGEKLGFNSSGNAVQHLGNTAKQLGSNISQVRSGKVQQRVRDRGTVHRRSPGRNRFGTCWAEPSQIVGRTQRNQVEQTLQFNDNPDMEELQQMLNDAKCHAKGGGPRARRARRTKEKPSPRQAPSGIDNVEQMLYALQALMA